MFSLAPVYKPMLAGGFLERGSVFYHGASENSRKRKQTVLADTRPQPEQGLLGAGGSQCWEDGGGRRDLTVTVPLEADSTVGSDRGA